MQIRGTTLFIIDFLRLMLPGESLIHYNLSFDINEDKTIAYINPSDTILKDKVKPLCPKQDTRFT